MTAAGEFIAGTKRQLLIYDPKVTDDGILKLLTERAFVGSQSLRKLELEERREVGIIIDGEVVVRLVAVFECDWAETDSGRKEAKKAEKAEKSDKRDKLAAAS